MLSRHGLSVPCRRSRKTSMYREPFIGCDTPNAVWSADLKGWFPTGDGTRCDPLTITDNYSRYLLRCQAVPATDYTNIQPVFEAAFREYGLPVAIRTDNGPPFATTTVGGHRTLKQETASPPKRTWRQQQQAFDCFQREYNQDRPHEAIGQQPPASLYSLSPRPYPLLVPEMTYPEGTVVRTVLPQGDISWKNHHVYLSETLAGELVGLRVGRGRFAADQRPIVGHLLRPHQTGSA